MRVQVSNELYSQQSGYKINKCFVDEELSKRVSKCVVLGNKRWSCPEVPGQKIYYNNQIELNNFSLIFGQLFLSNISFK